MPRHRPCLHASAAFWPVNSHTPQPDHPELGPDPFTQTHYDTERIQVPEAKVSIPAVRLPAGVQVWKGVAHSVATTHGYLPKTLFAYNPFKRPRYTGGGFYGSSQTAQRYSETNWTGEDTSGVQLSFIARHKLKLIDIGDVGTANAIRALINTVTPEKVATDPRYYYFLEMISGALPCTERFDEVRSIDCDEAAVTKHMKDIPYGDFDAVSSHFGGILAPTFFHHDGTEKKPLQCFDIHFETKERLFRFLMEYNSFEHPEKKYANENKDINYLYRYYTYDCTSILDARKMPLKKKASEICEKYFEFDRDERHRDTLRKMVQREFSEYVEHIREDLVWALVEPLANPDVTGLTSPLETPFSTMSRYSTNGRDSVLARLLERFVLKFCYFDGWIYIEDTDAVTTNLNTAARHLTYDPDTSVLEPGLHSEIYLTGQGKAKVDYAGYNRF
jgi:hypothetical protein